MFGLFALRARDGAGQEALFSLGAAFAAASFLGAGLIHMLPDSLDVFGVLYPSMEYPLAFLLTALGFVAILFLERVLGTHAASFGGASDRGALYPYLLAVVLSAHSILAGIALGAEDTVIGWTVLFVAIMAHKGSAAFALGVSLVRGGLAGAAAVRLVVVFSVMTPAGIAIGTAFSSLLGERGGELLEAVFDGLAAGTFLYIAALDIIGEEFADSTRRWSKITLLFAGLALMAALAVLL